MAAYTHTGGTFSFSFMGYGTGQLYGYEHNGVSGVTIVIPETALNNSSDRQDPIEYIGFMNQTELEPGVFEGVPYGHIDTVVIPPTVQVIQPRSFKDLGIKNLVFLESPGSGESNLVAIGEYAFAGNNIQSSITIPPNVTNIREGTFKDNSLAGVTFHDSITEIQTSAFENAFASTTNDLVMPHILQKVGPRAFKDANLAGNITFDLHVTLIGEDAFRGNAITSVRLKRIGDVTKSRNIYSGAFADNSLGFVYVNGPPGEWTIQDDTAFEGATRVLYNTFNLVSLIEPELNFNFAEGSYIVSGVKSYDEELPDPLPDGEVGLYIDVPAAHTGPEGTLPVSGIEDSALYDKGIWAIDLPENTMESIPQNAFSINPNLADLIIPAPPTGKILTVNSSVFNPNNTNTPPKYTEVFFSGKILDYYIEPSYTFDFVLDYVFEDGRFSSSYLDHPVTNKMIENTTSLENGTIGLSEFKSRLILISNTEEGRFEVTQTFLTDTLQATVAGSESANPFTVSGVLDVIVPRQNNSSYEIFTENTGKQTYYIPETRNTKFRITWKDNAMYEMEISGDDTLYIGPLGSSTTTQYTLGDEISLLSVNGTSAYYSAAASSMITVDNTQESSETVPCFLKRTRVLTTKGYKPIEKITRRDRILTSDNTVTKCKLIKTRIYKATHETVPYKIPKNTFQKGIPSRDVYVSPWHAIRISKEGIWTTPSDIKNTKKLTGYIGKSFVYYNIETEDYLSDTLVVEGLPVETYGGNSPHKVEYCRISKDNGMYIRQLVHDTPSSRTQRL